jgi:CBS domain containing-hemolysin-like protein
MITMEDLLEEIVGEIRDEYDDDEEDPIIKLKEREYQVLGSMNLEDLCEIIPLGFTSEDYDTIGGYIVGAFDHFPNAGETYVSENGAIIRVLAVDKKRITKLRIKLPAQDSE